ncbi:MAG TPA: hypothetical protein VK840_00945 [Candidatus Dormibacteraeota bacterium]|nr:hypothetical protein [Candidatus Dormibacteraeota bacterium]
MAVLGVVLHTAAMDRWVALSMIESGDNDYAVGTCGEISRYQIKPEFWPGGDPSDAHAALATARQIMSERVEAFERSHNRAPSDYEFYILWNAPGQVDHPRTVVRERARRFENLIQKSDSPQYAGLALNHRQN